jgi:predicted amidohydrolase YtcJ
MAARLTAYVVVAIVGATLIAGLIVGAQRADGDGPVDLIVLNARIYRGDAWGGLAQALAVRGNRILRIGNNRDINRLRQPDTIVIDAGGGAILPGFTDAHMHLLSGGLQVDALDLSGAATLDQLEDRVRAFAEAHPGRSWIRGRGWRNDLFAGGRPTRRSLDELVGNRPAQIVSSDGQATWLNTRGLRAAGISAETRSPRGGVVVKGRTGEPTGLLEGTAQTLASRALPEPTRAERLDALRAGIEEALRYGITSVHTIADEAELELLDELRRTGELRLRVYAALPVGAGVHESQLDALDVLRTQYAATSRLRVGAADLTLDGHVEARTAAMLAPYADRLPAPRPKMNDEELRRVVTALDRRGWQVMIHAAGDASVRMALDAIEWAARVNPEREEGRRHRIEHVEIVDEADVPRFGRLGAVASMQPVHGTPTPGQIERLETVLGALRAPRAFAYGSLANRRVPLAFGSDWPVGALDPLLGLGAAVTRMTPEGTPEGGWVADQALALRDAIDAYTSGGAHASFDEDRTGTLAAGMMADLIVLSEDIFDLPARELRHVRVDVTVFDGKVVYERPRQSTTN